MKKFHLVFLILLLSAFIFCLCSCDEECKHSNISEIKTEADCNNSGATTFICNDCGYMYKENIIEPKGHSFSKTVKQPECTSDGYTVYECECGYTYISDYVSALGHTYVDTLTAASCKAGGYTTHKCSRCEYTYISNHTNPISHTYTETVYSPTCTAQGYTVYSCKNCEQEYIASYTAPLGHTMTSSTLSPTCTTEGKKVYSCENCSYAYTEVIKPTGHSFSSIVTMPTLSDMGYTEYTCSNEDCGYSYVGDLIFYSDILPGGAYSGNSTDTAQGIDVSEYNYGTYDSIDFAAIKATGIDYVIIKAGSSYRDGFTMGGKESKFEQNYTDAKAAGLDVGVYFYTYARNVNEIIRDARLLISILDGKQFEYPIYLDLEDETLADLDKATLTEMCVEFFTILQRAGYYTGLYVNETWLKDHIDTETALEHFEIWYARPNDVWDTEKFGENLGMWQYSFEGSFESMEGVPFDLSLAYKNYPEIIKAGGFNGYSTNEIKFVDSDKEFVYVRANSIKVRSTSDFDVETNVIGYGYLGDCFEIVEKSEEFLKIKFGGQYAYITANTVYVSFEFPV